MAWLIVVVIITINNIVYSTVKPSIRPGLGLRGGIFS